MFAAQRFSTDLNIRMSAELSNIDKACLEARSFLQEFSLDSIAFDVLLGMRETLANAVLHGSHSNPALEVSFRMSLEGDALVLAIEDQGAGFNWRQKAPSAPSPESTHGRGLPILHTYFDSFTYNDRGSKIVLTKKCKKGICMSDIKFDGESAVINPGRDIVSSLAQEFREELKGIVDRGVKELTVELLQVEMIDSIGMGLLIAAHNSLVKNGGKLKLVNASQDILGLLRTMRLDKHFQISGRE